jgi:hypothetical protein
MQSLLVENFSFGIAGKNPSSQWDTELSELMLVE